MLRQCFMGLGRLALQPGRRVWWTSEPTSVAFGAHRVLINADTKNDFLILMHGWRVGEMGVRFDQFPPNFGRGAAAEWLHPMHGTVHLQPGQAIELEVENAGPRAVMARGGLLGVADVASEPPWPLCTDPSGCLAAADRRGGRCPKHRDPPR